MSKIKFCNFFFYSRSVVINSTYKNLDWIITSHYLSSFNMLYMFENKKWALQLLFEKKNKYLAHTKNREHALFKIYKQCA